MSHHAEFVTGRMRELRSLALEYLGATVRYVDADVDRLVGLLASVEQAGVAQAVREADHVALEGRRNRKSEDPAAAFQSGAYRVAWELRQLAREYAAARDLRTRALLGSVSGQARACNRCGGALDPAERGPEHIDCLMGGVPVRADRGQP